jgi:hypothetical protein
MTRGEEKRGCGVKVCNRKEGAIEHESQKDSPSWAKAD